MGSIAKELIELLDEHIEKKVREILHNNFEESVPPPSIEKPEPTSNLQQETGASVEKPKPKQKLAEEVIPADFLEKARRWIGNNSERQGTIRQLLISIGASRLSALTYDQYLIVDRAMEEK